MTVKAFFKSTAFKSLAVLIAIVLVAGALLAVCNDLLYVSDEERFARSLAKIYGSEVTATEVKLTDEERAYQNGSVDAVYYVEEDGNYLFHTTGTGGYGSGGTVTLWTILTCTGSREDGDLALTGIEKVVYDANSGQTLMANFGDAFYAVFEDADELVAGGGNFSATDAEDGLFNLETGATYTSTAACNAVNTALACFRTVFMGGDA